MAENRQVGPSQFIFSASMGADITSSVIDARDYSELSIQLTFTGTAPIGIFEVQGSLDQTTWISATLDPVPVAAGVDDQILIELVELATPYYRVFYDRTSGTGTLQGYLFGKGP